MEPRENHGIHQGHGTLTARMFSAVASALRSKAQYHSLEMDRYTTSIVTLRIEPTRVHAPTPTAPHCTQAFLRRVAYHLSEMIGVDYTLCADVYMQLRIIRRDEIHS